MYSPSRIIRRIGQLGIPFDKAIKSPWARSQMMAASTWRIKYQDGKDGTVGWGMNKTPIFLVHTTPHTEKQMLALLGL